MAINDPTDLTANPLGTKNLYVGARNASDLDKIVNGTADWYVNRFGNNIRSMASLTNLYDQFQVSFAALQAQFSVEFQTTLDDFNTDSQTVLNAFSANGTQAITDFNTSADEAFARIGAFDNTGEWVTATAYVTNQLWQDPSDLTWYLVLMDYTSGANVAADIASGNVAIFSSSVYNYSYVFINDVLGDKITFGSDFDDVDAYDLLLGKVYGGTATAAEINVSSRVNNQLGIIAGA